MPERRRNFRGERTQVTGWHVPQLDFDTLSWRPLRDVHQAGFGGLGASQREQAVIFAGAAWLQRTKRLSTSIGD